jgi:sigma-B regulation protein RsbU (phosphoserine phosphatase)
MNPAVASSLRDQLVERRSRLTQVISTVGKADDLLRLLQQVDSALSSMDTGTYGSCEVCHKEVEEEVLRGNPMARYCLCELSIQEQERLQQDLDLAWRIQSALLPTQDVRFAGWEVHYRYQPAGPVSGDYCDVVAQPAVDASDADALLFLLGDVSGKGVAASFLMAHLNALFRSLVEARLPTCELVERANRIFSESTLATHYATLVCGRAVDDGTVEITNAGHCPPLVIRNGTVAPIDSTGIPVGIARSAPYETHRVELEPGDTLFLYSDGLSEAADASGKQYGDARLAEQLAGNHRLDPVQLAAALLDDQRAFVGNDSRHDDLTVMVIRRTG